MNTRPLQHVRESIAVLCVLAPLVAFGATPTDVAQRVGLDQCPGAQLPMQTAFRDEHGARVTLAQLLDGEPAIVAPVYYDCPNICTVTLTSLLRGLDAVDLAAGR